MLMMCWSYVILTDVEQMPGDVAGNKLVAISTIHHWHGVIWLQLEHYNMRPIIWLQHSNIFRHIHN